MRRTLLVTQDYFPKLGGVARYYHELCSRLDNTYVLTNVPGASESGPRIYEEEFYFKRFWPRWAKLLLVLPRYMREYGIEHVLVGQLLPVGTAVALLKAFGFVPGYTVFTHGMDVTLPARHPWKKLLVRWILKNAESVITVSQYTRNQLVKLGVSDRDIHFVYPSVNCVEEGQWHDDEVFRMLTVARLVRRKGIDVTIDALKAIRNKPIEYRIIGSGPDAEYLQEKINELNNRNITVVMRGAVSDNELHEAYATTDVFIMPSRELSDGDVEGFGMVFIEANSFGKPVIAGRSGGIPDAVIHTETGLLVEPSVEGVQAAILSLIHDPMELKRLGTQGKQRVQEQFTWDIQAKKLKEILS